MAPSGEKPYKVYRGGRTKGKVPLAGRDKRDGKRKGKQESARADGGGSGRQVVRRQRKGWTWRRWVPLTLVGLLLALVLWGVAGYFSVRSGVADANARLPDGTTAALKHQNGLLLSNASNILLLGTDHSDNGQPGRSSDQHSDSMMLLRTDPTRHRLIFLSIPRDLRASIPGHGESKINAAMQIGGPPLAVATVSSFTGLPINHVVIVDFGAFKSLIDGVGGIDINVPEEILSNRFDCPYKSQQRCDQWQGWRFHKGVQHMNGQRALIYSRIRENRLNPGDSDITRALRQQDVMQQTLSKLASASTFFRLPFDGSKLLAPIATDLSTMQFAQLAWVKFRAGTTLHCRLGGTDYGDGYITGTEENIAVVQMVLGNSAPQPPPPGSGPYGPGCVTGNETFK
ncbi:MAG TPA: LCP family protein [Gaiellaceae bacterium]|nr:LCP family protein [Gaiellaceae bacterium]